MGQAPALEMFAGEGVDFLPGTLGTQADLGRPRCRAQDMSVTADKDWGALAKETCLGLGTGLISGVAVNLITGPIFDAIGITRHT